MRARNIKPGICDNEILGKADFVYTVLFERLWMMADRDGRLEDRPARIKAKAFPYRDGLDAEPLLQWLHDESFILRYESTGKRFIQILEFKKHQRPHSNEAPSEIPAPTETALSQKAEITCNQGEQRLQPNLAALRSDSLIPDSGLLIADSGSTGVASLAARKPTPEGEMAIALRDLGVTVTSMDQTLAGWIRDGITVQQAVDAVGIARIRKPRPERIPANYLDPILREPLKPPRTQSRPKGAWDRLMEANSGD